jgi:hypothetical protein
MAEREGFEPPIPVKVCRFSRPVPSTARPPLRNYYSFTTARGFPTGGLLFSKRLQRPRGFKNRLFQPITHPSGFGLSHFTSRDWACLPGQVYPWDVAERTCSKLRSARVRFKRIYEIGSFRVLVAPAHRSPDGLVDAATCTGKHPNWLRRLER